MFSSVKPRPQVFVIQTITPKAKPNGPCQMVAFLSTVSGGYDLVVLDEEPMDFLRRMAVFYCHIDAEMDLPNDCQKGSLARHRFTRGTVVDRVRHKSEMWAVAWYRQMVFDLITMADIRGDKIKCFSLETMWSDYMLLTELQQNGQASVYVTNDGADTRESNTALCAFKVHRQFEDSCLIFRQY